MAKTKKIVCLANSRKHSGRCVAGKEIFHNEKFGDWVRPVSARGTHEVSEEERRYENGVSPRVLDIISIPVIGPVPQLFQTENVLLDASSYWIKEGQISWKDLGRLVDEPGTLWANGDSTYYGLNDRVRVEVASEFKSSIFLIKPNRLTVKVAVEGAQFGGSRRRVRANFGYQNTQYSLIVTDPELERLLLVRPDAEYRAGNAYLCISLGEPHSDGCCYKLVATVITEKAL